MDSLIRGRVWPNGEFCLWKADEDEGLGPEVAAPIGLSKVPNSHKDDPEYFDRLQRGLRGITNYGQKLVRNAAYLLQQVHGGRRLSFLTCTLPGSPEETMLAAQEWPRIVRVYLQWLKRRLLSLGLSPVIVSVTEIQPKRFLREGGLPLHLHMVFQGAPKDFQWMISPDEFTEAWKRVAEKRVPVLAGKSFTSAVNVQAVKESAAGYLGKYMSKGEDDICSILDANPELIDFMPRTWYNMTAEARSAVKANTAEGRNVGEILERWTLWDDTLDSPFKYVQRVEIKDQEGYAVKSFVVGEVQCHWKRVLGVPTSKYDIVGV